MGNKLFRVESSFSGITFYNKANISHFYSSKNSDNGMWSVSMVLLVGANANYPIEVASFKNETEMYDFMRELELTF